MFPPIEPFQTGFLSVGEDHEIYWEMSGNPYGRPALFLHGGPGGRLKGGYRRRFDPEKFLIVSFEQRGCGRSLPLATDLGSTLASNTTQNLIEDIEKLRQFLEIESWLVSGVSWGTTLALAYAQAHPERVSGLVLAAVTTTTESEVVWLTEAMGSLFPREWSAFREAVRDFSGDRLIDQYYEAIQHPDPRVRESTARAWCAWEDVHPSLDPNYQASVDFQDAAFRIEFATLVIHYWKHAAFLPANAILSRMHLLRHVPGVMIHGRYDVSSPTKTAWNLHQAWPASELLIINEEGHGGPKMMEEMALAISRVSDRAL